MKQQRGISLIVVLIGLIIISFAAVALLRSTDTATLVAGNLTLKKAALASGDAGTEVAAKWLADNATGAILFSDGTADGYYATTRDACDLTGSRTPNQPDDDVDWAGSGLHANCNMAGFKPAAAPAGQESGYTVRYIINRMCNAEGDPTSPLSFANTAMICSGADTAAGGDSTQGGLNYGDPKFSGAAKTYYRITTQVSGPRDTVRYVQAFVVM